MKKYYAVVCLILLVILIASTAKTEEAISNLNDDSHPDRIKLEECIADVKEVTSWSESETRKAALKVCELRTIHAREKAKFLTAMDKLNALYKDTKFSGNLPTATKEAWNVVKSCIDFKQEFTYPHNVGLLIVPEDLRIRCYRLGSGLVESEL